jgi:hypothetical protein
MELAITRMFKKAVSTGTLGLGLRHAGRRADIARKSTCFGESLSGKKCHYCHQRNPRSECPMHHDATLFADSLAEILLNIAGKVPDEGAAERLLELADTAKAIPEGALIRLGAVITRLHPDVTMATVYSLIRKVMSGNASYIDCTEFVEVVTVELDLHASEPDVRPNQHQLH